MTDLPDYLAATGLPWQERHWSATRTHAALTPEFDYFLKGNVGHETLSITSGGTSIGRERIIHSGEYLTQTIGKMLSEHYLPRLLSAAVTGADLPPHPTLSDPLLTAFNTELRVRIARVTAALAQQHPETTP